MPYPLIPMPSFGELCVKLEDEFDCIFKTVDGTPFPITYFERTHNGKKFQCPVSFNDDSERLTPIVLRHICRRLKIDPKQLGLYLE